MIKLYYSYLITFLFCMGLYLVVTSSNINQERVNKYGWLYGILLIINCFLPVSFENIGREVYIVGANIYYIYLIFILFIIGGGIYLLIFSDKIDRRKSVPVFFYMVLSVPILPVTVLPLSFSVRVKL